MSDVNAYGRVGYAFLKVSELRDCGRSSKKPGQEKLMKAMAGTLAYAFRPAPDRPHSALGYQTPEAFAQRIKSATNCHAVPGKNVTQQLLAKPTPNGVSARKALAQAQAG